MTQVSIVTVCFNSAKTISNTLRSVGCQKHSDIEQVVIDGASSDDTVHIVQSEGSRVSKLVSEPDHGIYDAMNKGLALASGDLVGFLNSDDAYFDENVISDVVAAYENGNADFVYGDLLMVNSAGQTVRNWKSGEIPGDGLRHTQIPHPALFVKRSLLNSLAPAFDSSYKISADLKQQLIFINKLGAKGVYVRKPLVRMSIGGASTGSLRGFAIGWTESARAYNEVFEGGGWWYTAKKVASKVAGIRRLR